MKEKMRCHMCGKYKDKEKEFYICGGRCKSCNLQYSREWHQKRTKEELDKFNAKKKEQRKERRREVIKRYGGVCICCGEDTFEFLTLDHKNNDGADHRKELGRRGMCAWAKLNNYPDTLQVLCYNCNNAKAYHGECPHQKK